MISYYAWEGFNSINVSVLFLENCSPTDGDAKRVSAVRSSAEECQLTSRCGELQRYIGASSPATATSGGIWGPMVSSPTWGVPARGATKPGSADSGPRRARPSAGTITCRFSCSFLENNLKTFLLYIFSQIILLLFLLWNFSKTLQKLSKYFQKTLPLTCFTKIFIHKTFCVNNFVWFFCRINFVRYVANFFPKNFFLKCFRNLSIINVSLNFLTKTFSSNVSECFHWQTFFREWFFMTW
jgi:hypothetical protein